MVNQATPASAAAVPTLSAARAVAPALVVANCRRRTASTAAAKRRTWTRSAVKLLASFRPARKSSTWAKITRFTPVS